jgi:hypothetical protein
MATYDSLIAFGLFGVSEILPVLSQYKGTKSFQGIIHSLICIGCMLQKRLLKTPAVPEAMVEREVVLAIPTSPPPPAPIYPPPPDTPQYRAHRDNIDPHAGSVV